jgi:hypothetical protein
VSAPPVPGDWCRELRRALAPLSLVEPRLQLHQEVMGQDHQRHVMMPAPPETALVVVQAEFILALGEAAFDRPAHAARPDQGGQRQIGWGVGQVILVPRRLAGRGDAAADHQPDGRSRQPGAHRP